MEGRSVKLVRVGESGRERAAVLGLQNEILWLPVWCGDIDNDFWIRDRLGVLRAMLNDNTISLEIGKPERFGPPIAKPGKVICIGLNYRDHANETGSAIPDE